MKGLKKLKQLAFGLPTSKYNVIGKEQNETKGVMKLNSLEEVIGRVNRMQKLKEKKDEAGIEMKRNNQAKELEEKIAQNEKGENR